MIISHSEEANFSSASKENALSRMPGRSKHSALNELLATTVIPIMTRAMAILILLYAIIG